MQSDESQDVREQQLLLAKDLSQSGDFDRAYDITSRWLTTDPNDPEALNLMGYIMLNTDKPEIAYPILKMLTQIEPENSLGWLNFGMAASDLWRYPEAKRAYKQGIKHAANREKKSMQCVNMASCMVDHGDFAEAEEYCLEAIELRPDTIKGHANLGFCQLARRNWAEGWKNYRYCINSPSRPLIQYNDEPLWNGKEKGVICIYTEQGLGDEISFASMLPDMKAWCDKNDSRLIVDVNPRLEALFKRSFPDIEIHGTRGISQITWDPRDIEYSLPIAQLGEYFRLKDSDFPGTPYMVADPDRVLQWKALFQSKKKPTIGIAWRGGTIRTAAKYRQFNLEQLAPILKCVDAHFVSLQYKPSQHEIDEFKKANPSVDFVEYPYGTLSGDFDDSVAMVQALDLVICMQTTIGHVAGSLGVPAWVFVPKTSQWRYGQDCEDFVWANSMRILRQNKREYWDDVVDKTATELYNLFCESDSKEKTPRKSMARTNGTGKILVEGSSQV